MRDHRPLALAQALLRCPSVTPVEGGALAAIADVLGEAGFAVERPVFSAPGTPRRREPVRAARRGEALPRLRRSTSTWCRRAMRHAGAIRPSPGAVENGELYGRGAVDMKGGIACMMAAALSFARERGPDFRRFRRLSRHGRRGRAGGQRYRQASRMGAREGRALRPLLLGEPTNPTRSATW
jgi:succinyl-diaminopimelate desuccinylase